MPLVVQWPPGVSISLRIERVLRDPQRSISGIATVMAQGGMNADRPLNTRDRRKCPRVTSTPEARAASIFATAPASCRVRFARHLEVENLDGIWASRPMRMGFSERRRSSSPSSACGGIKSRQISPRPRQRYEFLVLA